MKKIVIMVVAMILMACASYGQTTISKGGKTVKVVADTASRRGGKATDTGYTLEKGGKTYRIMKSASGRCFIEKTSKNGKQYKDYASVDACEPWTFIPGAKQPNIKQSK